ncbi:hypothetical protein FD23_GL001492 [Lactobacillus delbrueckii subsp. delbrueckii DSM 20074 = JCM 1012]|uniref:GGDEF domain-containing protein n=1 Tax=Lactobacillus delbrueckii TaxID=1584 RepID=UPI0006EFBCB0|nr:GGDEF domain-containing protein [Lactobacillus delbrueckii]KRK19084.1 hypothetical protein FD23_GL001492 [Lactobacillus delbrueckii subsp. delbrueckii DSM 20074 = JCM 1012]
MKQVKILDLKFDIHISAGYVYGQAQTPDEVYEMIREADRMLYQSKDTMSATRSAAGLRAIISLLFN